MLTLCYCALHKSSIYCYLKINLLVFKYFFITNCTNYSSILILYLFTVFTTLNNFIFIDFFLYSLFFAFVDLLHRDIKPSNLLLNTDCHVKLCDFGLCRSVADTAGPAPVLTDYVYVLFYVKFCK
jgi:serine/threonine protein kinase